MQKNRGQKDELYFSAQDFFACESTGAACRFGVNGHEGQADWTWAALARCAEKRRDRTGNRVVSAQALIRLRPSTKSGCG